MKDLGESNLYIWGYRIYRDRFGKLLGLSQSMYIDNMLCTRPDVSFVVSVTSKFQSIYGEEHWAAVKNILKYLRRTEDLFLVYGEGV